MLLPAALRILLPPFLCAALWAPLGARAEFEVSAWPRGKPVPALRLVDADGVQWTGQSLQGRVVLLNFWATWCEPCRAEMPGLSRLARAHASDRLLVLAVNYQESVPRIRRYQQEVDMDLPVLLDADGAAAKAWTRRIFPTTVVLGTDGRPRHVITGQYDWTSPEAGRLLAPLLNPVKRQR